VTAGNQGQQAVRPDEVDGFGEEIVVNGTRERGLFSILRIEDGVGAEGIEELRDAGGDGSSSIPAASTKLSRFICTSYRHHPILMSGIPDCALRSHKVQTIPAYRVGSQQLAAAWHFASANCRMGRGCGDRRVSIPSFRIL
jgi:hypothetical protein